MKNRKALILTSTILLYVSGFSSSDIATSLLDSYQCKSVGAKTNQQINALTSLEAVVSSIQSNATCNALAKKLSALPEMGDVIKNLRANEDIKAIKKEEEIINQALADLSMLNRPGVDKSLYPSEDDIRQEIVSSNVRLNTYKAQLKAEEIIAKKQSYLNGLDQMDQIANTLNTSLENTNSQCFKKNPALIGSLTGSLAGLSGFFMSQPIGMITTLGGKAIQYGVSLVSNLHKRHKRSKAYGDIEGTKLVTGVSCAFEALSTQRCNLEREYDLFSYLSDNQIGTNDMELKATCSPADLSLLAAQTQQDLKNIVNWVTSSNNLGLGVFGDSISQNKLNSLREYDQISSSIHGSIADIKASSDKLDKEKARKNKIAKSILNFQISNNGDLSMGGGGAGIEDLLFSRNDLASSRYSTKKYNETFINLVMPPGTNQAKISTIHSNLKKEYEAKIKKENSESSNGYGGRKSEKEVSATKMYQYLMKDYGDNVEDSYSRGKLDGLETTKEITGYLLSPGVLSNIDKNLGSIDKQIKSSLGSDVPKESLNSQILEFYGKSSTRKTSPMESLKRVSRYLKLVDQTPIDEGTKNLLDIKSLQKRIDKTLLTAGEMQTKLANNEKVESTEWKIMIKEIDELAGPSNNLENAMKNINDQVKKYVSEDLKKKKISKDINEKDYVDSLFKANHDVLSSAIVISDTPTTQDGDFKTALELSSNHISGLGTLLGRDIKKALSAAGKKNDPYFKNKLCISLLALPKISNDIWSQCKRASMTSRKNKDVRINFSDYAKQPLKLRSCAFENYLFKEKHSN